MTGLERFDDDFAPRATTGGSGGTAATARGVIHNGIVTMTDPSGTHRTFRIRTQPEHASFAPGKRIVSLLTGPDNTRDYRGWGFVTEDGRIILWKKFRSGGSVSSYVKYESYAALLMRHAAGEDLPGYHFQESRHCRRCNKILSDPESIEIGLGPTCRGER